MPTIKENQFLTVLIEFAVDPSPQQAFLDAIADIVEQHFKSYAGFVSANFHASEDGQRVVNYAQWQSKQVWRDSFQASNRNEVQTAIDKVISRYGVKTLKVEPFGVMRVIENA
ncbi:antibiotic biosynthesis monooxygenase [Nostoc sp. LPT]|uniref:antibiotic biosynthesis monooxygenase n=1 Tax=Nostoc sp. LPT TaxID=2815387 RepID=UPI001DCFE3E6|nr:antibiotic biosynthesis monooxygenase [Nostoc sp. LPT]MBN4000928.1 antibiotic biosynthesis monooxygenase [Nostoc sp. LPT]